MIFNHLIVVWEEREGKKDPNSTQRESLQKFKDGYTIAEQIEAPFS